MRKNKILFSILTTVITSVVLFSFTESPSNLSFNKKKTLSYGGSEENPSEGSFAHSASVGLRNPPSSTASLVISAGQLVFLKLYNSNVLPATMTVESNHLYHPWNTILAPFSSETKRYDVFAQVPVGWTFNISTISDAASVSITALWN